MWMKEENKAVDTYIYILQIHNLRGICLFLYLFAVHYRSWLNSSVRGRRAQLGTCSCLLDDVVYLQKFIVPVKRKKKTIPAYAWLADAPAIFHVIFLSLSLFHWYKFFCLYHNAGWRTTKKKNKKNANCHACGFYGGGRLAQCSLFGGSQHPRYITV